MTQISRRIVSHILVTVLFAVTLVGVTACAPTKPQLGVLQKTNGGVAVTVPALWVDSKSNTSGMEYTTVWAGHNSGQQFTVKLDDIAAKGAGSSWRAASASAAAVGSLMSGTDPKDLAFNFAVTGPIDGPSAGGILTVGVLAALRETPLKPTVTMTGTISPDGSIGEVSGIAAKMRAAAGNGFDTVVLPQVATKVQPSDSGDQVDTIEYGSSLGLHVHLVQNVTQAYEIFTGTSLFDRSVKPYSLDQSPSLISARFEATTRELVAAKDAANLVSKTDPLYEPLQKELAVAQQQFTRGNADAAFGIAVDVLNQAARHTGTVAFTAAVASSGLANARTSLSSQMASDIQKLESRLTSEAARVSGMTASQMTFLPSALTWLSYAHAVVVSLREMVDRADLSSPSAVENLATAAGITSEQMAGADVTFEQNLTMLQALPVDAVTPVESPITHLSAYTNFLVAAGQENEKYINGVFGVDPSDVTRMPTESLIPVIFKLSERAKLIEEGVQTPAREVEEASIALSYYATTSLLVSSSQALGIDGIGLLDEIQIQQPEFVAASLKVGSDIVHSQASQIFHKGLQPGFASWSTEWGVEAYNALSAMNRVGAAAVISLNEVWFDTIALYMLNALTVK